MKVLIAIGVMFLIFILLFLYCACKISGDISRIEEENMKNE